MRPSTAARYRTVTPALVLATALVLVVPATASADAGSDPSPSTSASASASPSVSLPAADLGAPEPEPTFSAEAESLEPAEAPPAAASMLTVEASEEVYQPNYHTGGPYPGGYHVESAVSVLEYRNFESFYIIGKTRYSGTAGPAAVFLESAPVGSGNWTRIEYRFSSSSGYYEFNVRPEKELQYRVVVARGWDKPVLTASEVMSPKLTGRSHTLEERRAELAWRLGEQTRTVRTMKQYQYEKYPLDAVAGRWQTFEGGLLAEITRENGKKSTWYVDGTVLDKFIDLGGWTGKMGTPARDVNCVALEGSCTQLFSGGAIYSNKAGKVSYVLGPSHWRMEIVAAAMSQVGYREPSWRHNKFNSWIDDDNAWCGVFMAWASSASGHANAVPQQAGFTGTVRDLTRAGVLKKGTRGLAPGQLVLFDYLNDGRDAPSHVGIVVRVSGGYVYTVEGNTTSGTGSATRGVFHRARPISTVWGTADPEAFVWATD